MRAPAPQVLGIREREGDVGEAGVGVSAEPLDRSLQRGRGGGAEVGAELEVPNERVGLAELVAVDEGDDDALGAGARGASGAVDVGLVVDRWVEVEDAGIATVCDAMLDPGDVVLVAAPTFSGSVRTMHGHRARVVALPTDADGLDTAVLGETLERLPDAPAVRGQGARAGGRAARSRGAVP